MPIQVARAATKSGASRQARSIPYMSALDRFRPSRAPTANLIFFAAPRPLHIVEFEPAICSGYPRHSPDQLSPRISESGPAEFLHGPAGVPDFCHVPDLVA